MKRWFNKKRRKELRKVLLGLSMFICICLLAAPAYARATGTAPGVDQTTDNEISAIPDADDDTFDLNITSNLGSTRLESTLQILILLTILSLAPSILILLTSFTRVIVVFHFLRTAMGTQTTPPNQVLAGLAVFITFDVMAPVFNEVNTNAVQPYMSGSIKQEAALDAGIAPFRNFMLKQTRDKDLKLFMTINGQSSDEIEDMEELSILTIIPAFIISELRTAFIIGFILYLPFIVIDMVVASTLMSMGMMMLPPTTISLPFKILLFVLADGWNLLIGQLVQSFQ
ncbi:MAG: flagellar type III secretion system pore protein FliP [Lachnospiraceae bacterium]|nr:flagellar type III secretion system pore protein FliP [Lachnospiraceae bacterium]